MVGRIQLPRRPARGRLLPLYFTAAVGVISLELFSDSTPAWSSTAHWQALGRSAPFFWQRQSPGTQKTYLGNGIWQRPNVHGWRLMDGVAPPGIARGAGGGPVDELVEEQFPEGFAELNSVAQVGYTQEVEEMFQKIKKSLERQYMRMLYNTVIKACAKSGDIGRAEEYFEEMRAEGIKPNDKGLGKMVEAAQCAGDHSKAAYWLQKFEEFGVPFTGVEHHIMLRVMADAGDLQGAEKHMKKFEELMGRPAGTAEYNYMAKAAARSGNETAAEFWAAEANSRVSHDQRILVFRNKVVRAAKLGNMAAVDGIFEQMSSESVDPDILSFNSAIGAAARAGDMRVAEMWFWRMSQAGFQPDVVSFSTLMDAAARTGWLKKAQAWFDRALVAGIVPSSSTVMQLINAAIRARKFDQAETWAERVMESGVPDKYLINAMVNAAAKRGDWEAAQKWVERGVEHRIMPGIRTYNALFRACPDAAQAELLLEEAVGARLAPDEVSFGSLVGCAVRAQNLSAGRGWLEIAADMGIEPDMATLSSLISRAAKAGDSERAERWFNDLVELGLQPNDLVYLSVMDSHAGRGDVNSAAAWRQRMENDGFASNEVAYNILWKACMRSNPPQLEVLEHYVVEMVKEREIWPSQNMIRYLQKCIGHKKVEEIIGQQSSRHSLAPEGTIYTRLNKDSISSHNRHRVQALSDVPLTWSDRRSRGKSSKPQGARNAERGTRPPRAKSAARPAHRTPTGVTHAEQRDGAAPPRQPALKKDWPVDFN